MLTHFMYSLGDTFVCKETGKTYELKEWRVYVDTAGITIKYGFHAYMDDCFGFHDFIEEGQLENGLVSTCWGCKEYTSVHLEPVSVAGTWLELPETDANGETIRIGDTIFSDVYYYRISYNKPYIPATMTFASYDRVTGFTYSQELKSKITACVNVERIGPSHDSSGKAWLDARREGRKHTEFMNTCILHADDRFVETYIAGVRAERFYLEKFFDDGDSMYEAKELLRYMGKLDEITDRLKSAKPAKKKMSKSAGKPDWEKIARELAGKIGVDIESLVSDSNE
jgi:hypothetical protein